MKNLMFFIVLFLIVSCVKDEVIDTVPESSLSKIVIENSQFVDSEGSIFYPWGLNYTNPEDVGLIEDDWLNENVWQTINEDFAEMKVIGANVIRIHLQFHQFMNDATTPNQLALDRLEDLVELAEKEELYLDVTGLAAYRKSDQPDYYLEMTDEERWETQKIFWQNISKKIGDSPAVFAYNLMNEPVVSVGCDTGSSCDWTPGDGLAGFHFVQNITRTPGNQYVSTLKSWIAEMTEAIRSNDSETLITVGLLDLGSYSQFAEDVDYLSPHIYPKSGEIQEAIERIEENQSNVPIVIEEIYNYSCNIVELEEFTTGIEGKYSGLMGHYFGTPIDLLDDGNINHAIQKNFLNFFIEQNPN